MKPAVEAIRYLGEIAISILFEVKCVMGATQRCFHIANNCVQPLK
jgi:hypothetical protein